jgi:hypothetical protein
MVIFHSFMLVYQRVSHCLSRIWFYCSISRWDLQKAQPRHAWPSSWWCLAWRVC